MDSPSTPPTTPSRLPLAVRAVLALVVVGYGWFIYQKCSPYAGGSDSSGYLNSARLLSQGKLSEPVRAVPGLVPPGWNYYFYQSLGCNVDAETGRMVPSYPIGLPLHLVIAGAVVGLEKAARVINTLNALAAGLLLYALGRQLGLVRPWAFGAVAVLWACPVWIFQSLQPMSDQVATTWALAAILGAWRARDRPAWAVAAGAAFAIAVLVRPTSMLLIVPLLITLGGSWRAWSAFALGGLPFALGLGTYNHFVYGSSIESGYNHGGHNIFDAFSWEFFHGNLRHFAVWIPQLLSPPIVILAVLGLPWLVLRATRTSLILLGWAAAFIGLYSCYFCAGETWWYLRFLLPAFPAIILAALLVLQRVSLRLTGRSAWLIPAAVLAISVGLQCRLACQLHVTSIRNEERNYWVAGTWVREHVPANAILLSWQLSGALLYYNTQTIVRWDLLQPSDFDLLRRAAAAQHRPIYATLFLLEPVEFQEKFAGQWLAVGHPGNVTVLRLVGPAATEGSR